MTLFLAACAGGGGGGNGKKVGGSRPSTGFRVLHANIDAAPVDIFRVGETSSLGSTSFGQSSGYISTRGEAQSLSLTTSNIPAELQATVSVPLEASDVKTVLFYGNHGSIGVRTAVISDPQQSVGDGSAMIRVIHGAVGAAAVSFTVNGASLGSAEFGEASDYKAVTAGPAAIVAKRVSDGGTIFNSTLTLESGKTYSLFLSGDMTYLATGALLSDD